MDATEAEQAFATVPAWERWTVRRLQAHRRDGHLRHRRRARSPTRVLMTTSVMGGSIELDTALWLTTGLAFAYWPVLLAFSIGVKWLVIGRYRPGRYPVWSFYYFRWWLVNRFQGFSWSHMFVGTPLMGLYYRAMGAKVGRNVTISTSFCSAFDLVIIGERSEHRRRDAHARLSRRERHALIIGRIDIGPDCFVGMHCLPRSRHAHGRRARLDDMSALVDGTHLRRRRRPPRIPVHAGRGGGAHAGRWRARASAQPPSMARSTSALIYAMGYFLVLRGRPGGRAGRVRARRRRPTVGRGRRLRRRAGLDRLVCAVADGREARCSSAASSPASIRSRAAPTCATGSCTTLLNNTRTLLLPVYATVYLPPLLRLLGAKIGTRRRGLDRHARSRPTC